MSKRILVTCNRETLVYIDPMTWSCDKCTYVKRCLTFDSAKGWGNPINLCGDCAAELVNELRGGE